MEENKKPITNKKQLTDENLEQVTGGVNLPLNLEANESGIEAASLPANPYAMFEARVSLASNKGTIERPENKIRKTHHHYLDEFPTPERDPRSM